MNELNRHRFPSQLATALRAGPDVGDDDKLQACPPPPRLPRLQPESGTRPLATRSPQQETAVGPTPTFPTAREKWGHRADSRLTISQLRPDAGSWQGVKAHENLPREK